jgi:exodeoxyribonuclease VII large subunit
VVPKKPIRVSQLNAYLARLIAADRVLSDVAVTGEISNLKLHGSGHVYFSLIDEASRIDCFLPSGIYRGLGIDVSDGIEVVAEGYVNVYEKGGRYSLTIRRMTAAGQGDLALAFEQLKQKLKDKGYFDEEYKKPLPFFPGTVAIVTSETGAAISDMLKIIQGRNSVVDVFVFPSLVQGTGAAEMIASRIRQVNEEYPETSVMIVGRGGGSAEDLNAFNEEAVADAIFHSSIPVISAVGHETDFTIADFVADVRAETPTAAAQMAVPDTDELRSDVDVLFAQVKNGIKSRMSNMELKIRANNMNALLGSLKGGLIERRAHSDRLFSVLRDKVRETGGREPEVTGFLTAIRNAVNTKVERAAALVHAQAGKMEALDPKRVLARGYAIIEDNNGRAVSGAVKLSAGQRVVARFADGYADAEIKEVRVNGK